LIENHFNITGGDPILHPFFWGLLDYISYKNIGYSILGNPFHLDNDVARHLKLLKCRSYQFSIDGLKETHDLLRKHGSFNATLDKISLLKSFEIKVNIMSTVSNINYKELPGVARLMAEKKVDRYAFARYCPTHEDINQNISPISYKTFLKSMYDVYCELSNCKTTFVFKDHLWKLFFYERGEFKIIPDNVVYDGCGCGINHLTLLEDGIVYACRRFISPVGDINNSDFFSIFFGEQLAKYRDIENIEGCNNCKLLNYCRGCHAVSAGTYGDFFKNDPQCWINANMETT
jgi:radical SAM/SPASM domain protein of ACGX system